MARRKISIVGGGAAGFFAALAAAEADSSAEIVIFEATAHPLAKVRISGGGRCNVTHACFEPRDLVRFYPRGGRELLGAFTRWQPRDTVTWFADHGVATKTEADGRMFPVTDDSATVVDCLRNAATRAGIILRTGCGVTAVRRSDAGFALTLTTGESHGCAGLLLATGGNKSNAGFAIAREFGHAIEPPVPSLFTFHCDDARLRELSGLSVEDAEASVASAKLIQRGPVLVTHWGLSGPAILKLSAWGARVLHDCDYAFALRVNWLPALRPEAVWEALRRERDANPRRQVTTANPFGLPARLWDRLVVAAGLAETATWSGVGNASLRDLATQLGAGEFAVKGKSLFKEEFVTCGGVRLSEVDFRTMESRRVPGLHFAGEVLDIDGVTGGFNFQAAWTTGWLAGRALGGGR
ncbi:MAG TPA: NAD(P)/FAD-dependent oxidoreductase [Candidatus Didemnitutus sp.]|nr:NAD(P)/FAD-dependent oxidoreductase [Candidatus Didemnitutus sp.]